MTTQRVDAAASSLSPLRSKTVALFCVLFRTDASCPAGTFRCSASTRGVCLPRRLMCDGRVDCPDGSDENAYNCSKSSVIYYSPQIELAAGHRIDSLKSLAPIVNGLFSANWATKYYYGLYLFVLGFIFLAKKLHTIRQNFCYTKTRHNERCNYLAVKNLIT